MKYLRSLWPHLIFFAGTVALLLVFWNGTASAHIGVGTGLGFSAPHPLTPHIGRVYWTPGDRATVAAQQRAENAPTELSEFLGKTKKRAHRARCGELLVKYISRHGITTPTPLKGFHGCSKWQMDQRYWDARRNLPVSPQNPASIVVSQTEYAIHNIILPW